jgi:integrase
MRDLRTDLQEYMELRRALGYKLRKHEARLREFIAFLETKGIDYIAAKLAIGWATESSNGHRYSGFERLSFIRSFATHLSAIDPRTEIPPTGSIRRPLTDLRPYIYTQEEVGRLMAAARKLLSPRKLRCHTYYHLIGLLATTGMRSGEAVRLANSDVNFADGLITIRKSKFGKSRVIPIHTTTARALAAYKARRDAFLKRAVASSFFISEYGGPISNVQQTFREIRLAAGLEQARNGTRPRMHDLRHTFAVQTLVAWYRRGADVERRLPILSTFLGHTQVENTYWYLSSTPELLGEACERLEKRWRRSQ